MRPTNPSHRANPWLTGAGAVALVASLLACSTPNTNSDFKLGFEENRRWEEPDAQQPSRPAPGPAQPNNPIAAEPPPPPAPLVDAPMTPTERKCEEGDAKACHEFALASLKVSTAPDDLARAAMAMYQACDLGVPEACYQYGLMIWMRQGVSFDRAELAFALDLATKLGDKRAKSATVLLEPGATRADLEPHYEAACQLPIGAACDALAQLDRPEPSAPTTKALEVSIRKAGLSVSGGLDKRSVEDVFDDNLAQLRACYVDHTSPASPDSGTLALTITASPQGAVDDVTSTGSTLSNQRVVDCVTQRIRAWNFGAGVNNTSTIIVYLAEFSAK